MGVGMSTRKEHPYYTDPRSDYFTPIQKAYRVMANRCRYRPAAPSDGMGNVVVPLEELDLPTEADDYALKFRAEEDGLKFWIGCSDYTCATTMVLSIEAARACATGSRGLTVSLLREALAEAEAVYARYGLGACNDLDPNKSKSTKG
jgi:hypothetical protein